MNPPPYRRNLSEALRHSKASTGRDPAPPDERGTSADLGAGRESVVRAGYSKEGQPLFFAFTPQQIEAHWDDAFAPRLAGFPLNLLYGSPCWNGRQWTFESRCYWFDPGTYAESDEKREMTYFPNTRCTYRVHVEYHKKEGFWRTLKYNGNRLVIESQGKDFDGAMNQTTMSGLQQDEPIDPDEVTSDQQRPWTLTNPLTRLERLLSRIRTLAARYRRFFPAAF